MHLAELKQKSIGELNEIARDLKIDGAPNLRKQELIFSILQGQTEKNGVIFGEGVLDGPDLGITDQAMTIPGFNNSIELNLENPYKDMA